jgi:hypothetical protein
LLYNIYVATAHSQICDRRAVREMQGDLDKLYENEQIIKGSSFDGNINNRRDVKANFIRWQRLWRQREGI